MLRHAGMIIYQLVIARSLALCSIPYVDDFLPVFKIGSLGWSAHRRERQFGDAVANGVWRRVFDVGCMKTQVSKYEC
jgi:hypothetical protein